MDIAPEYARSRPRVTKESKKPETRTRKVDGGRGAWQPAALRKGEERRRDTAEAIYRDMERRIAERFR
jgi:hypothetical protein